MPATKKSVWFSGPRTVEVVENEVRSPDEGEVRIKAICSGISHGTEMLVYRGEAPRDLPLDSKLSTLEGSFAFPIKYGYASVGRVIETGPGVKDLSDGDLVFAFNPHESDYTIPSQFAVKLPGEVNPRAGVFFANVETAINALLDAAPRLGERIVVLGQGVVGLLITHLARRAGASLIVTADLFSNRRALSLALGADLSLDPASESVAGRVRLLSTGSGADIVIEASGRPEALDEAIKATASEGRVIVVSWYGNKRAPINLGDAFHRNRVTVRSSQVSNLDPALIPRWDFARRRELAVSYLMELPVEKMITHSFRLDAAAAAYRLVDTQPDQAVQVLLEYE